ncbi:MAG: DUF4956 domain-containing protein [Vulcanibacillus sp.]
MEDFIMMYFNDLSSLDLTTILLNNAVTIVIGSFIMLTYRLTYSGTAYSKKFNVSLGMLTIVTTLIMSVISNNIALSLGMVGALSIIRFRTPVKDPRDITFIFWSISIGVACGISQYIPAAITSVIIFLFLIVMKQTYSDGKMLLIIKCNTDAQIKVQVAIEQYFSKAASLRMKNANAQNWELVYEISKNMLRKAKNKNQIDIFDKLLKIEGVMSVNQVDQTEDISR